MQKIFFDSRYIIISSDYKECFTSSNSIVYTLQSLDSIPLIIDDFITNQQLVRFCIYTNNIDEALVFESICNSFTKIIAAGGLVQNSADEVLMIYRFNHWDLPKGKHEDNETIEETATREVEEECGISGLNLIAPVTKTYHIYQQNNAWILKETHWFKMQYKKDEQLKPQLEEGVEEVKWIPKNSISEYLDKTYLSIKEVFKALKIPQ